MIYDDSQSNSDYGIMLDQIVQGPHYDCEIERYEDALVRRLGGVPVNKTEVSRLDDSFWVYDGESEGEFITWVSPFNGQNRLQDISKVYGNESFSAGYIYCGPCIIARVTAASDRV